MNDEHEHGGDDGDPAPKKKRKEAYNHDVWNKKAALARRAAYADRAFDLRVAGKTYQQIADEFAADGIDVSVVTVGKWIKARLAKIEGEIISDKAPTVLALELKRLDALFEVAFARATGGPRRRRDGTVLTDPDTGEPVCWEPDFRYMAQAMKLSNQRLALLGLAPGKTVNVNVSGQVNHVHVHVDTAGMSTRKLLLLETLMREARGVVQGQPGSALALPAAGEGAVKIPQIEEREPEVIDAEYEEGNDDDGGARD